MAYSDPQTVTIVATPHTLNRVSSGENLGAFKKDDRTIALSPSHTYGKRIRRAVRMDHSKVAPDPLFPATNVPYSLSIFLNMDLPTTGYTNTEVKDIAASLLTWLTASTNANLIKLINGES